MNNFARFNHDDVVKWKHFLRYWPFVRGIHRYPVNSARKGQWHEALIFSLICVWINGWVNNRQAGDVRCYRAHYDVTVMIIRYKPQPPLTELAARQSWAEYRQTSNISRTLVVIVEHSDVVGASPVGAAPTTSSFSTSHLASIDSTKTTARRGDKHLSFGIWCVLY